MQKFLSPQNKLPKIEIINVDTEESVPTQSSNTDFSDNRSVNVSPLTN
jgi:hypothetical protein